LSSRVSGVTERPAVSAQEQSAASRAGSSEGCCPICGHRGVVPFLSAPDRFHGRTHLYRLDRCPACELVWLADAPSPAEMGQHYGEDYDRAISSVETNENHWHGKRDELQVYKTGGAILDLGCSSGSFLASLKGPNWKLYGIEMSEEVAAKARARTGAEVFVGDILDAPFAPASFDVITCFHVFEHLYHPREVLAKVSEWLKPGGIFVAFMPNIDSAGEHIFKSYWYGLELPRHLYHFSPASMKNLVNSLDLEVASITTRREVFIEHSFRYILDRLLQTMGMPRPPMAKAKVPSIPFRVVRKGFRLTMLPVLTGLASLAGDGEILEVLLRKPVSGQNPAKSKACCAARNSEGSKSWTQVTSSAAGQTHLCCIPWWRRG